MSNGEALSKEQSDADEREIAELRKQAEADMLSEYGDTGK